MKKKLGVRCTFKIKQFFVVINAVVKIKQFFVVINTVVKIQPFLVVINGVFWSLLMRWLK